MYLKCPEQAKKDRKQIVIIRSRGVDEEWGVTENGYKVSFWVDENVPEPKRAGGCTA